MKLFDGDDELFKGILKNATNYFEFGCGSSTQWVLKNTQAKITCVDSSQEWLDSLPEDSRLEKIYINIGQLELWGFPKDESLKHEWIKYPMAFNPTADVVLIDGRFRVSCFLTALLYSRNGTIIIFDDYVDRPFYHVVEEYIKPRRIYGRQAIFIKNNEVLPSDIGELYINDTR